jgi:hypothetical protein
MELCLAGLALDPVLPALSYLYPGPDLCPVLPRLVLPVVPEVQEVLALPLGLRNTRR